MKKLLFLLISFTIVGAFALQSSVPYNSLAKENAQAIMAPEPNCNDWQSLICSYRVNSICGFHIPGTTCYFPNHSHYLQDPGNPSDKLNQRLIKVER